MSDGKQIAVGAQVMRATGAVVELPSKTKADGRKVALSFSSEAPVLRAFEGIGAAWEVLGHGPDEVDMSRLAGGAAPLLKDHKKDLDSQVGVVERAWIEGGKGRAIVRFAETDEGSEMLERVRTREVGNVSCSYEILGYTRTGEREGIPVVRVKWRPFEISLVAVPADASVGVGRSLPEARPTLTFGKTRKMENENTHPVDDTAARSMVKAERKRASEINAIARHFDMPAETVADAIADGTSVDGFRKLVMDQMRSDDTPAHAGATMAAIHNSAGQPYSLVRAINAELSGDWSRAGFEREISQEMARVSGRAATGFYVPPVAIASRDLLTTSNAASLIGTDQMYSAFIDALTPSVQVMQMGATFLPGLRENVSVPRMTAGTSAAWIAENAEAAESTPGFDAVTLSLKQLSARASLSRRQLKQSLPFLDSMLQNDLRREIGIALDRAAINGAGSATEPEGILNTSGIGTITADGADGRTLTWAHVCVLMAAVEGANAPGRSMGFLSNPKVKAKMLSTPIFAGAGESILTADGDTLRVADYRAAFTTLVPSTFTLGAGTGLSALIFGDWSELLVGQWGGVDIIVDDVTEASKGNVKIVAHSEWDISVRNAVSFAAVTDIVA